VRAEAIAVVLRQFIQEAIAKLIRQTGH